MIGVENATQDSVLKIITGENIFRFIGKLNHSMEFRPIETGEHTASLEYEGFKEVKTLFTVNQPDYNPSSNIVQRVYEPLTADQDKPVFNNLQEADNLGENGEIETSKD